MQLPETWNDRVSFLAPLADNWRPVTRRVLIVACAFYGLFLLQLTRGSGPFLIVDLALVPVHEGGHLFFMWFGQFIAVAGGTIFQLGLPALFAGYFLLQRQVQGTAFCTFILFEQMLPVSTYMADARAQALPLISVGDSDDVIHDWNYLFSRLGLLNHDLQIAHAVRAIGWIGMFATIAWMVWRSLEAGGGWPAFSALRTGETRRPDVGDSEAVPTGRSSPP